MRVAIFGRTSWLLDAARLLEQAGHRVVCIVTARETAEAKATARDFQDLAAEFGTPFVQTANASRADVIDAMRDRQPDLGLTMNYPGLFRSDVLNLLPLGMFNCHGSLLPKYRGNACPNWAIIRGESETGITIHAVVDGQLDNGDIVLQRRFPLGPDTSITEVYRWYDEVIPAAMLDAVEAVSVGRPLIQQDEALATYSFPRRPEDSRLDFRQSAMTLHRLVLASSRPFAGAYAMLEGTERITVWKSRVCCLKQDIAAVPGQVLGFAGEEIRVKTEDGVLVLTEHDGMVKQMNRRSRFF
jgi:methionyl-tRNA formyltransferase